MRKVVSARVLSVANVRVVWKSQPGRVPAHVPATLVVTARLLNTDPGGGNLYGETNGGPSGLGAGDTAFDETIDMYPASYLTAAAGTDVNQGVNDLVQAVASLQVSDPDFELWLTRIFGRLIGESISHEMFHTLLPIAFTHNEALVGGTSTEVDTGEMMDAGMFRTLLERTGISETGSPATPADLLSVLVDGGIGVIDSLSGTNKTFIDTHFPVPPAVLFDR